MPNLILLALLVNVGSRLELFVDDYLIETMRGVHLKLHEPRRMGKVLAFDQPWEGNTSAYVTVFQDDDRYRMYYRGSADPKYVPRKTSASGLQAHPEYVCYAESRDGIAWTKPAVGQGNNVLWSEKGTSHNFAPFRDANPAATPAERYKALAGGKTTGGLIAFRSADGLHWSKLQDQPVITDGAFDSLNIAFWDATRNRYVAIYRDFRNKFRTFKHATSTDFRTWTPGEWADFGAAPVEQLYTNAVTPYFRAPHLFLGFPKRFVDTLTVLEDSPIAGVSESVFLSSRDGVRWDRRFLEAFLRPGRDERDWIHRNNMIAAGLVPTGPDEMSLYVSRHYSYPTAYVERLALRTDGLVSVHADYRGGELVTKPLEFRGTKLVLNYATSAAGSIRVEADGELLGPPLAGDRIEHEVPLGKRPAGAALRLRFVMKDADLYSLRFRD